MPFVCEIAGVEFDWSRLSKVRFIRMLKHPRIKYTHLDMRHKVFDSLNEDTQTKLLEYFNKEWYCAAGALQLWDKGANDCPNCCCFCPGRTACKDYKCHLYNPLMHMSNCPQWIDYDELLLELMPEHLRYYYTKDDELTWKTRREREYIDMFRGFHIYEEIERAPEKEIIDEDIIGRS